MNRNGVVTEVKGERAVVQLLRHTACGECGACQLGDDSKQIRIECANDVGAQVGEFVEIDLESPNVLGAAFIMYMIPLVALLAGVLGGTFIFGALANSSLINPELIKHKELAGAVMGVVLMTLTYFVIKGKEDKFSDSQKYLSRITKVERSQLQT